MSTETVFNVIMDSLWDSLLVLLIVFLMHVILSFFETKIAEFLEKSKKLSPLYGSLFGLIPQCSVSVIGADLYLKEHITVGTLVSMFIACSDEAIPLLLADHSIKSFSAFALIGIKLIIGFVCGFMIDLIIRKKHEHQEENGTEEIHTGCCHHHIDDKEEKPLHKHLVHPLLHSLKIFLYVFIINLAFGFLFEALGEENITSFLQANKYLTPLFSSLIGLIPNCSSSIILTELYTMDSITFSSLLAGLTVNSGLGMMILLKNRKNLKKSLLILLTIFLIGTATGYLFSLILGF